MSLFSGLFTTPVPNETGLFQAGSKFRSTPAQSSHNGVSDPVPSNLFDTDQPVQVKKTREKAKGKSAGKAAKDAAALEQPVVATDPNSNLSTSKKPLQSTAKSLKRISTLTAEPASHAREPAINGKRDGQQPKRKKVKVGQMLTEEQLKLAATEPEAKVDAAQANVEPKLTPEQEAEKLSRTVFVGNLPKDFTRKQAKKLMAKYGQVESVRLRSLTLDKENKLPRKAAIITGQVSKDRGSVNAYVVFHTQEAATAALKSNMTQVGDHHIRVDRASQPAGKRQGKGAVFDTPRSVFVGNLHFEAEDEELVHLFTGNEAVATTCELKNAVEAVRVVRDPRTQLGKGFAIVLFKSKAAARAALDLDGKELRNRPLRITRAKASPQGGTPGKGDKPFGGKSSRGHKPGNATAGGSKGAVWQGVRVKPGSKQGTKMRRSSLGSVRSGRVVKQLGTSAAGGPGRRSGSGHTGGKGGARKNKRPALVARKIAQLKEKAGGGKKGK